MNVLSPQDLLLLHDEQLRTAAELDGAADPGRIGPLWVGRFGSAGFVSYRDLAGIDAAGIDDLIAAVLARFAADPAVVEVEWKTRGHDAVPFLADRLLAAGFAPQEPETVMVGQAESLTGSAPPPPPVRVRRAGDGGDLAGDVAAATRLHQAVFGEVHAGGAEVLLEVLTRAPDRNQLWFAEAGGAVIGTGRLARAPGTRFVGLFGGAVAPAWRHHGIYRVLTAARAAAALELGCDLVYAECTPFSRPILARSGLVAVTTATAYIWSNRSNRPAQP